MFPGLIYRMIKPRIVLLIFVSGKVVLTGKSIFSSSRLDLDCIRNSAPTSMRFVSYSSSETTVLGKEQTAQYFVDENPQSKPHVFG